MEPHTVQEAPRPVSGEARSLALGHAAGHPAAKQIVRKLPGVSGGYQVEHEPAVCFFAQKASAILGYIRSAASR